MDGVSEIDELREERTDVLASTSSYSLRSNLGEDHT